MGWKFHHGKSPSVISTQGKMVYALHDYGDDDGDGDGDGDGDDDDDGDGAWL